MTTKTNNYLPNLLALGLLLAGCQPETTSVDDEAGSTSDAGSTSESDDSSDADSTSNDTSSTDGGTNSDDGPAEPASVLLRVTSPEGTAVGIATITVDGTPHFTDAAGFLHFTNLDDPLFTASVSAPGYTAGAVAIELSEGLNAYDEVLLFPLGPAQPLDADLGGTVEHDGVQVEIPPGSLVNEWGEYVTGQVEVTITALDPTTEQIHALPGPLEAVSAADEDVALLSFAMTEVSLWQGDMPLQLAPGAHAQLELALPPDLAAALQPGDEIPAWWLDLDEGIWREESTGVIVPSADDPNVLVWQAEVSHFTWYNCDNPANFQNFECYVVTIVDNDDHALQKSFVTVTPGNGVFTDGGYSTDIADVNVGSNCILAPIGGMPVLTVGGLEDFEYVITEGKGEYYGLCNQGGTPNPNCTKVRVKLPPEVPPVICTPGQFQACPYSGTPGTEGQGICQAGYDYCIDGGIAWSGCEGEVVPSPKEDCTTAYDDDCNGTIEDADAINCDCVVGEMVECYGGPVGTNGEGLCDGGYRTCDPQLHEFGECVDDITPSMEDCDSPWDEDCDGLASCDPPEVPVLQLGFSQVKQFDFSWTPTVGAQWYQLLESVDGEPHAPVGSKVFGTATSLTVPLHFRPNASYVLQACNPYGCTDSAVVDVVGSVAQAVGYFKASNTDAYDYFGWGVALSSDGSTLAVGAPNEASNAVGIDGNQADDSASAAGAVYVYAREADVWTQQAYVKASNTGANDSFGWSVALSSDGSTLAVGAIQEDSNAVGIDGNQADDSALNAGAVYVYTREADVWTQQAYVKASNTDWGDQFGLSVALSSDGSTLAVGAHYEDSNAVGIGGNQADDSADAAGAVYVYAREADVWTQQAYVKASNTDAEDYFGYSVALSSDGSTLAVGAYGEASNAVGIDGNQADDSAWQAGAVYVYAREADVWTQQAYVKASNTDAYDYFGWSVALSGNGSTLAVGAYGEASNAVGIDGNQADDSSSYAGAVYVYTREADVWTQQAYVKASNTDANDYFGYSVALSGDGSTLAVGAHGEDSNAVGIDGNQADDYAPDAGAVYVYAREADIWTQQAYVKASNSDAYDRFGEYGVALSSDGSTLAVGTLVEASNAVGIGGDQADNSAQYAGAVYLY